MNDFLDEKHSEIRDRLKKLQPAVDEYRRLEAAASALAGVGGEQASARVDDQAWIESSFLPGVGKRGAAIIEARGASSAASAASAAIDHVHDWVAGTEGKWVSMGVASDGSYGVPEGLISGFPCTCAGGDWSIVTGLELDEFSRTMIDRSVAELIDERDAVKQLGLI